MQSFDRGALLRRGGAAAAALSGWCLVGRAGAAVDPRLRALQRLVRGPVLVPSSPGYAQARLVYQERFDDVYPLAVVQPLSAADVGQTLAWARRWKLKLAIRSGGHSYAGYSTTSGVVIDLSRLRAIRFDRASGIVSVAAGARLIDVEAALAAVDRAIPTGSCASVGIGGLALGGGVGFASRAFGTTSDNVVALGIVTADGRYRVCSASTNADLFWACRGGGGGNFGVVTHFDLATHPVGEVATFVCTWPWSQASAVAQAWQAFAPHAPDGLFSICSFRGGSSPSIECSGQYLGSASTLGALLTPLTGVAGALLSLGTNSYFGAQLGWAGCAGLSVGQCHIAGSSPQGTLPRGSYFGKSDYIDAPLSSAALQTIVRWIEAAQGAAFGGASLLLDSYGGAINRVAPDATAFVHRNALCSAQYLASFGSASHQAPALAWLRGFYAAMRPYVSGYAYQNYIDPDLTTWKHAYYGANLPRLRQVKAAVDPDWLFRFAQAIPPA